MARWCVGVRARLPEVRRGCCGDVVMKEEAVCSPSKQVIAAPIIAARPYHQRSSLECRLVQSEGAMISDRQRRSTRGALGREKAHDLLQRAEGGPRVFFQNLKNASQTKYGRFNSLLSLPSSVPTVHATREQLRRSSPTDFPAQYVGPASFLYCHCELNWRRTWIQLRLCRISLTSVQTNPS